MWQLPLERWEETLRANLTATFLVARAFLREVERNGHGSLVLVGSTAGVFGEAGHADYAAAKSAITSGLLLSLKNEIGRIAPGGRVNAVAPGWTETPMTRGHVDPEQVRAVTRTMALRKVAQPEDVAAQVVVLASDVLSGHVTGQLVVVAGGMEGRTIHVGVNVKAAGERRLSGRRRAIRPPRDRPSQRASSDFPREQDFHSEILLLRNEKGGVVRRPFSKLQARADCRQSPAGSRSRYRHAAASS